MKDSFGHSEADLAKGQLSTEQQILCLALTNKSSALAEMYVGACVALGDDKNPQRVFIAAYCCRELMDHMPDYLDVPSPREPPGLNGLIHDLLLPAWGRLEAAAGDEAITKATTVFLKRCRDFLRKFQEANVTRTRRSAMTLDKIDPSSGHLPQVLQDARIREWAEFSNYFNAVLHHNQPDCPVAEFRRRMTAFERFLLTYLRPRTFDDYTLIDQIIAEGERDA